MHENSVCLAMAIVEAHSTPNFTYHPMELERSTVNSVSMETGYGASGQGKLSRGGLQQLLVGIICMGGVVEAVDQPSWSIDGEGFFHIMWRRRKK